MFNLGALASNVLNSIDSAAKETLEEPKQSATAIRRQKLKYANSESHSSLATEDSVDGGIISPLASNGGLNNASSDGNGDHGDLSPPAVTEEGNSDYSIIDAEDVEDVHGATSAIDYYYHYIYIIEL